MKKLYAILFIVALVHTGVYGQAKKPTIMVVPANVWCTHNGYTQKYNNQGIITEIPYSFLSVLIEVSFLYIYLQCLFLLMSTAHNKH